jgi:hypothetical protein
MIEIKEHDLGGCYVLTDKTSRFNKLDMSYDEIRQLSKDLKTFVDEVESKKKRAFLLKSREEWLEYA